MPKSKYSKQFDVTAVLQAVAGGVAGGILVDQLEDKVKFFQSGTGKQAVPFIPALLGSLIIYSMDDSYKPLGYGMLGATGLDVGDDLADKMFQGFSRVNYLEPGNDPNVVSTSGQAPVMPVDTMQGAVTLNDMMTDEILM
tara:strand:- start:327 stop:746 length:420 start_codon:yes stop_codon:yes gene_type:complete